MSFDELFQFMMIILNGFINILQNVVIAGIPLLTWVVFSSIICSLLILIFRTAVRDPIQDMYAVKRQVRRSDERQAIYKSRAAEKRGK